MISVYKKKTSYYIELSKSRLQEVLDDNLVQMMGYPHKEGGYTFEEACFQLKYLANGNVAVGIQLVNVEHFNNKCVVDYITKEGFNLAKQMYKVTKFLTQKEYNNLEQLQDEDL